MRLPKAQRGAWLGWFTPLIVLLVLTTGAVAAPDGIALVIGNDAGVVPSTHADCRRTARSVRERLQAKGFVVDLVLDGSAVALRTALDDLAAHLADAPPGPALIYVCAAAVMQGPHLFVLPPPAPDGIVHAETDGLVVQVLANALAGKEATVFAELALPPGSGTASVAALQRVRLPTSVHLATTLGDAVGVLGIGIAGGAIPVDQSWPAVVQAMRSQHHSTGTRIAWRPDAPPPPPLSPPAPHPPPGPPSAPPPPPALAAPPPQPAGRTPAPNTHRGAYRPARQRREVAAGNADARLARLQAAMWQEGLYDGPQDGRMNPRMQAAIGRFQSRLHEPATGVLTQSQVVRLLNPLPPNAPESVR